MSKIFAILRELRGSMSVAPRVEFERNDVEAIRGDWKVVGRDLRTAIESYVETHGRNGQIRQQDSYGCDRCCLSHGNGAFRVAKNNE